MTFLGTGSEHDPGDADRGRSIQGHNRSYVARNVDLINRTTNGDGFPTRTGRMTWHGEDSRTVREVMQDDATQGS